MYVLRFEWRYGLYLLMSTFPEAYMTSAYSACLVLLGLLNFVEF